MYDESHLTRKRYQLAMQSMLTLSPPTAIYDKLMFSRAVECRVLTFSNPSVNSLN